MQIAFWDLKLNSNKNNISSENKHKQGKTRKQTVRSVVKVKRKMARSLFLFSLLCLQCASDSIFDYILYMLCYMLCYVCYECCGLVCLCKMCAVFVIVVLNKQATRLMWKLSDSKKHKNERISAISFNFPAQRSSSIGKSYRI